MALTSRVVTREIWAVRDIVKLHAVEWRPRDGEAGAPIMAIGGALSNAWDAEELGRAAETPYWDDLASLGLPVLTITGTAEGVRARPDDAERYRRARGAGSLVVIDGADHSLTVNGDHAPFFAVLRGFLADVDRRASGR